MTAPPTVPARPAQLLEFLDFSPKITDRTTLEGRTKYDKFSGLIGCVNKWLEAHPNYDLISIESVQVSPGEPIPEVPIARCPYPKRPIITHPLTSKTPSNYIRGVRIWIRHNPTRSPAWEQVVRYWTMVPNLRLVLDKTTQRAVYTTSGTDELFAAFNNRIKEERGGARGRFLCAEIFSLYLSADRINPEMTAWSVTGTTKQDYVEALRVFYLVDENAWLSATLGYIDLLPAEFVGAGDNTNQQVPQIVAAVKDSPESGDKGITEVTAIKTSRSQTDQLLASLVEWQNSNTDLKILRLQTYLQRKFDFTTVGATFPRLVDDVVQAVDGLRVIYCAPSSSPRPDSVRPACLKTMLLLPKLNYEISLCGKWTVRHESQLKLLGRMGEWARFSQYTFKSFEVFNAETVLLAVQMPPSPWSFWGFKFLRGWWKRKPTEPDGFVVKGCRVYYWVVE